MDIPLPGEPDPELSKLSIATSSVVSPSPYNIPLPSCGMQFSALVQHAPMHLPDGLPPPLPPGSGDQLDDPNRYSPSGAIVEDETPKQEQISTTNVDGPKGRRVTVLGKAQAKKRLLAFSMTKQGGGSGLSFGFSKKAIPKVNAGSAKAFAGAVMEEDAGENKETRNEKPIAPIKKKGSSKKGPTREDKARAVISAIEEIKREELLMRGVLGYGQHSSLVGDMTAPLPLLAPPLIQAKPKEEVEVGSVLSEQQKGAIDFLIDSLLTHDGDKKNSDKGDAERDTSKSDRRRNEKDDRKKESEKSSHSKDRVRSKDRRSRSTRDREKEEKKKNRPTELPTDWAQFRVGNYKLDEIRRLKLKMEKDKVSSSSRDRHRNRSRERRSRSREDRKRQKSPHHSDSKLRTSESDYDNLYRPFETTPRLRFPFMAVGIRHIHKEYPRSLIRYTKVRPVMPYCENPSTSKAFYRTRTEILCDASPRVAKLMQSIIDGNSEQVQVKMEKNYNKQTDANLSSSLAALQVSYDETEIDENMSSSDDITGNKKERSWYIQFSALTLLWGEGEEQDNIVPNEIDVAVKKEKTDEDEVEGNTKRVENSNEINENELSNYLTNERDRESNIPDSLEGNIGMVTAERTTVRSKWDSDYEEDKMSVDGTNIGVNNIVSEEVTIQHDQDSWSKTESEMEFSFKGTKLKEETEEIQSKQTSDNEEASESLSHSESIGENNIEEVALQGVENQVQDDSFNKDECENEPSIEEEEEEEDEDEDEEEEEEEEEEEKCVSQEEPLSDVSPRLEEDGNNSIPVVSHTEGSTDLKLVSEYEEFMKAVSFDTTVLDDDDHVDKGCDGEEITAEESDNSVMLPLEHVEEKTIVDIQEEVGTDNSHDKMDIEPIGKEEPPILSECSEQEMFEKPKLMTSSASEDELLMHKQRRSRTRSKSPEKVEHKLMSSRREVQHAVSSSDESSSSSESSTSESEVEERRKHRSKKTSKKKKKKKHIQLKKKRKKASKKKRVETSSSDSDSSSDKDSSSSSSSDEKDKRSKKHNKEASKRRSNHNSSSDKSGNEGSSGDEPSSDAKSSRRRKGKVKRNKRMVKKKESRRKKHKRHESNSSDSEDNTRNRQSKSNHHKDSIRRNSGSSKRSNDVTEASKLNVEKKKKENENVSSADSSRILAVMDNKSKREKKKLRKGSKKLDSEIVTSKKKDYNNTEEKSRNKENRKVSVASSDDSSEESYFEDGYKKKENRNNESTSHRKNMNNVESESEDEIKRKRKKKVVKKRRRSRRSQSTSPLVSISKKRRRSPSTSPEHSPTPQRRSSTEGKSRSHGEGTKERSGEGRKLKHSSGGKKRGEKQGEVDSSDDPDNSSSSENNENSVYYNDSKKYNVKGINNKKLSDRNIISKLNNYQQKNRDLTESDDDDDYDDEDEGDNDDDDDDDDEVDDSDNISKSELSSRREDWWHSDDKEDSDSIPYKLLSSEEIKQEIFSEEEEREDKRESVICERNPMENIEIKKLIEYENICAKSNMEKPSTNETVDIESKSSSKENYSQSLCVTSSILQSNDESNNDNDRPCDVNVEDSNAYKQNKKSSDLPSLHIQELYSPEHNVDDDEVKFSKTSYSKTISGLEEELCGVDSSSQLSEMPLKSVERYESDMSLDSSGNVNETTSMRTSTKTKKEHLGETSYLPPKGICEQYTKFDSGSRDSYISTNLHRSGLFLSLDNIPLPPPIDKNIEFDHSEVSEAAEPLPVSTNDVAASEEKEIKLSSVLVTPDIPSVPVVQSRPVGKQRHVITVKLLSPSSRFQATSTESSNKLDIQSSVKDVDNLGPHVTTDQTAKDKNNSFSTGGITVPDNKMGISSSHSVKQSWKAIGTIEDPKPCVESTENVTAEVSSTSKVSEADTHQIIATIISEAMPKERQRKRPSRWGMTTAPAKKMIVDELYGNIITITNDSKTVICSSELGKETYKMPIIDSKLIEGNKENQIKTSRENILPSSPQDLKHHEEMEGFENNLLNTWVEKRDRWDKRDGMDMEREECKDKSEDLERSRQNRDNISKGTKHDYYERRIEEIERVVRNSKRSKEKEKRENVDWSIDKEQPEQKEQVISISQEKTSALDSLNEEVSGVKLEEPDAQQEILKGLTIESNSRGHGDDTLWESRVVRYRSKSHSVSPYRNREDCDHGRGTYPERKGNKESWDREDDESVTRRNDVEKEGLRWDDKGWRESQEHDEGRREDDRRLRDDLERESSRRDEDRGRREEFERDGGRRSIERARRDEIDRDVGRRDDNRDRREDGDRPTARRDDIDRDSNRRDDIDRDSSRRDDDRSRREDIDRDGSRRDDDHCRRDFSDRDRSSGSERERRESRDRRDDRRGRDQRDRDRGRDRRCDRERRESRWEREKRDRRRDDRSRSPSHDYRRNDRDRDRDRRDGRKDERDSRKEDCEHSRSPGTDYWRGNWDRTNKDRDHVGSYYIGDIPLPVASTIQDPATWPTSGAGEADMELSCSPASSPLVGFKRSLADSTISDSELVSCKQEEGLIHGHHAQERMSPSSTIYHRGPVPPEVYSDIKQGVYFVQQSGNSPSQEKRKTSPVRSPPYSPKRIPLDDRIKLELGVKKSPPPQPQVPQQVQIYQQHQAYPYPNYYSSVPSQYDATSQYKHTQEEFVSGTHQQSYPQQSTTNTFANQMPPPVVKRRPPLLSTPTNVHPVNWDNPEAFIGSQPQSSHNSKVVQVGNFLQVVPAEQLPSGSVVLPSSPSQSFILQSGNMIQVIPNENLPCVVPPITTAGNSGSSKNQVVQVGNVLQVIPEPNTASPAMAPVTSPISASNSTAIAAVLSTLLAPVATPKSTPVAVPTSTVQLKTSFVPPSPVAQNSPNPASIPVISKSLGMQLSPSPMITSPIQTGHIPPLLPVYSPPASPFLTAPVIHAALISPSIQEAAMPGQGDGSVSFVSSLEMAQASQMEEVERRRAERARRRQEKEKRRLEKERRHQSKLKQATDIIIKKAMEQDNELLEAATDEIDVEEMRLIEEAMQEVPEQCEEVYQTTPPPPTKKKKRIPLVVKPLPPAGKGILVSPGFREKPVTTSGSERKFVKFADGVRPGEGTSPSAGEDLPSPPPPPRTLPKEKRFKKKKKKKIKVKIIRQINVEDDDDDDEEDISPPPPPPGSPPPPPMFPPAAHYPATYPTGGFTYSSTPSYTVLPGVEGSSTVSAGTTGTVFTSLYHQHHHTTTPPVQYAPPPPPPAAPAPPPPPPPNTHVFKRECPANP